VSDALDDGAGATVAPVSTAAARDLLVDLVSTPSVSGEEDAAAAVLVAFLEAHGRDVHRDAVGNVRAPGDDAVLLTSHLDTVPGDVPVRVEETPDGPVLWGRGSVDATGPLAAMAAAAVRTGVSFAGVVREETDSAGARHLVADREAPGAVVNGEPSGTDGVTLGYRGFQAGTYAATTGSTHSSRPEPNAVQAATRWWGRVEDAFARESDAPVFEQVTAKPVAVDGGLASDGTSVEATMDVQFRLPPGRDAADVRATVEDLLATGDLDWDDAIPPVMASARTPVARALRAAVREGGGDPRLVRKTGTSDQNIYAEAWNCPTATYGPGDSTLDHAPDERLPLAEFDDAVAVLTRGAADLADSPDLSVTAPGGEGA
jgi:LysW-gamma-L-lysine carboxypeptidase